MNRVELAEQEIDGASEAPRADFVRFVAVRVVHVQVLPRLLHGLLLIEFATSNFLIQLAFNFHQADASPGGRETWRLSPVRADSWGW